MWLGGRCGWARGINGQPLDFDTWSQFGNRGWSYESVLPYFRKMENFERAADGQADDSRATGGLLNVSDRFVRHELADAFIDAGEALGHPRNPDYNGAVQEGISYVQRTAYRGRRVSSATAFLNPAKRRGNLSVKTNAHATRVLLEGERAVGVEYAKGGRNGVRVQLRASQEVIVSGGAINSPQILQLSGIGPAALLKSLGIDVHHDLPGVDPLALARRQLDDLLGDRRRELADLALHDAGELDRVRAAAGDEDADQTPPQQTLSLRRHRALLLDWRLEDSRVVTHARRKRTHAGRSRRNTAIRGIDP